MRRSELARTKLDLDRQLGELELLKRDLAQQVQDIQTELKKRMDQVWLIELFLGSHEEVTLLRDGDPAPVNTKIAIHQRVLCMDEEVAVQWWLNDPTQFESFDCQDIADFDRWLVADEQNLNAILPEPKGIVALRVRRREKRRDWLTGSLEGLFLKFNLDLNDKMVYILVRNGQRLFRLWVDVQCWPRMFPRLNEWQGLQNDLFSLQDAKAKMKRYFAGMVVIQGLLERSGLLAPLPEGKVDVFDPDSIERHFNVIRDDEVELTLPSSDPLHRLTWRGYSKWLRSHLKPGMRVIYCGPQGDHPEDKLSTRTGIQSAASTDWPACDIYMLEPSTWSWEPDAFSFLYMPEWGGSKRRKFNCYADEIYPIDLISRHVVRHLLESRAQREHYDSFLPMLGRWYVTKNKEAELEAPFIDLVMARCGYDCTKQRFRAERLLRWWKMKTKNHRTLNTDDAKAFRMVCAALARGEDVEEDPEQFLPEKS